MTLFGRWAVVFAGLSLAMIPIGMMIGMCGYQINRIGFPLALVALLAAFIEIVGTRKKTHGMVLFLPLVSVMIHLIGFC